MLRILRFLFVHFIFLAPAVVVAEGRVGNESVEPLLTVGVTGSTPGAKRKNPTAILASADMQRLVLRIAATPLPRSDIQAAITGEFFDLEDMVFTGLLREEEGLFHIDFNLLTVADQQSILSVSEQQGRALAAAFLARRSEFETLAQAHSQPHLGDADLFYTVLGCLSLDWDGLDYTKEHGYRAGAQRTIDGRDFTPWAKEIGAGVSLKGLYWGSHNMAATRATFTTFGDHHTLPRFGIPDLLWNRGNSFSGYGDFADSQRAARGLVSVYMPNIANDIASVMLSLRNRDILAAELQAQTAIDEVKLAGILDFLQAAGYIAQYDDSYGSVIVVLGPEDAEMVDAMIAIGRDIMSSWHNAEYSNLKSTLSDLTPVQNGVPFERVYTEIWHFIFAIANRTLVEEGFFADPYAAERRHQGFLPFIWANGLDEHP